MVQPETAPKTAGPEQWIKQIWLLILRISLIVIGAYFFWRIRGILSDVLVSAILAFALIGPVDYICKRFRSPKINKRTLRFIATLAVFIIMICSVVKVTAILISPFQRQVANLRILLTEHRSEMLAAASSAETWYHSLPENIRQQVEKINPASMVPSASGWFNHALENTFAGIAKIVDIILIPVLAFYFVLDGRSLRNEFLSVLPRNRRKEAIRLGKELSMIMRAFVVAQIWLCIIAGVVVYFGLSLLHVQNALILSLLAGMTRAIPIIGPIIAGIPIIILSLFSGGPVVALKVLIFFSIMHMVESKLIMPKFIGHRIHLHAAVVIIVLLIGYEFFNLLGMFFAAPVAAFARVLINYYIIRPRQMKEKSSLPGTGSQSPSLLIKAQ